MSLDFNQLNSADKEFKYPVFGYLRTYETNKSITIPNRVKYICLNYYLLREQFTKHGSNMKLNEAKNTVQQVRNGYFNTVYGNDIINALDTSIIQYKWEFRIRGKLHGFAIGIDGSKRKWSNHAFTDIHMNTSKFYSWIIDSNVGKVSLFDSAYFDDCDDFDTVGEVKLFDPSDREFCNRDHDMTMVLDMKDHTLKFKFDDQEIVPHKNINLDIDQYHLAIFMTSNKQQITLKKFSTKCGTKYDNSDKFMFA